MHFYNYLVTAFPNDFIFQIVRIQIFCILVIRIASNLDARILRKFLHGNICRMHSISLFLQNQCVKNLIFYGPYHDDDDALRLFIPVSIFHLQLHFISTEKNVVIIIMLSTQELKRRAYIPIHYTFRHITLNKNILSFSQRNSEVLMRFCCSLLNLPTTLSLPYQCNNIQDQHLPFTMINLFACDIEELIHQR